VFGDFFFFQNREVYEIMWENIVEPGRPQMIQWRMRIVCWILKAVNTHTHSDCVILIAFPLQQWLHECAWTFRYTYLYCLSCSVTLHSYLFQRMTIPVLFLRSFRQAGEVCVFDHKNQNHW